MVSANPLHRSATSAGLEIEANLQRSLKRHLPNWYKKHIDNSDSAHTRDVLLKSLPPSTPTSQSPLNGARSRSATPTGRRTLLVAGRQSVLAAGERQPSKDSAQRALGERRPSKELAPRALVSCTERRPSKELAPISLRQPSKESAAAVLRRPSKESDLRPARSMSCCALIGAARMGGA